MLGIWYVGCMGLSGCFYVKPLPEITVNQPPEIVSPITQPQPVRVLDNRVVFSIRATDPEDDPIYFEWPDLDDVPYDLQIIDSGPIRVCRVEVLDASRLPTDMVEAIVVDDDPANLVRVVFDVVFP